MTAFTSELKYLTYGGAAKPEADGWLCRVMRLPNAGAMSVMFFCLIVANDIFASIQQ